MGRVVVLGSRGFLGRQITAACDGVGISVAGVDRVDCGGADSLRAVSRGLLASQPDVVFHAAGRIGDASPAELHEAHVRSTESLLADVAELASKARVVVIGSAAEVGHPGTGGQRVMEHEGGSPHGEYGRSKLEQSRRAGELGTSLGLDVVRVRLFNTLGRGQTDRLVGGALVERLLEAVRAGGNELAASDPESVRDFLDVRDVARCLLEIAFGLSKDPERPPINICSEEGLSVAGLVGELLAASGASVRVRWESGTRSPSRIVGECPTLRSILGGAPVRRIDTLTSLRDMWTERVARATLG